jgi:hypothetical protein
MEGADKRVRLVLARHIDNIKLLLICILLLSHSFIFFRLYFLSMYIWLYSCLILQFMYFLLCLYSYCMCMYLHRASWHSSATLTEVFPCFFLSYKANAKVKPSKMGHGPHSSKIVVFYMFCVVLCCIVCV